MNISSIAQAAKVLLLTMAAMVATATQASDTLTVTFTGDVLLDRGVRQVIEENNGDASCLFSPSIDSVFAASNLVVANLECPATKIKSPVYKKFIFRGEPEWLDVLKQHGITHLNLANNHSIDQGREGLIDTRNNIIKAGMVPIGAGENMDEAAKPVKIASSPRNVYVIASLRMALENTATYSMLVQQAATPAREGVSVKAMMSPDTTAQVANCTALSFTEFSPAA